MTERTLRADRASGSVGGDKAVALTRLVEHFKAQHPDKWEELRLCPLQHGVETMIELLKG